MTPILEIKNLNKNFGGIEAVKDFSLQVEKKQIIGLIGPNGAGKTTLFNLISGFLKPDSGMIMFKEKNITKLKPYKIANMGISRTFQLIKPFSRMLTIENIAVGYYSKRAKEKTKKNRDVPTLSMNALKRVGLVPPEENLFKLAEEMSHGMSRRLDIARALVIEPEVLLLDEPFGGLGVKESTLMASLIQRLHKEDDLTIVVIEHKMRELMKLAKRIVVMNFGEKIADGSPKKIGNNQEVCEAYLGKDRSHLCA